MGKTWKDRRPKLPRSMKEAHRADKNLVRKKKGRDNFNWREEVLKKEVGNEENV